MVWLLYACICNSWVNCTGAKICSEYLLFCMLYVMPCFIHRCLSNCGLTVTAVDSGRKALEVLDSVNNNVMFKLYFYWQYEHRILCSFISSLERSLLDAYIFWFTTASEAFIKRKRTFLIFKQIDLIFTDYCMPEMSGYELLRQVKVVSHYFVISWQLKSLLMILLVWVWFSFTSSHCRSRMCLEINLSW